MRALRRAPFIVTVMTLLSIAFESSAWADPPSFPDMSHYTPANVTDYEIDASTPGIHATQVVFLTPDSIRCSFNPPVAGCTGNNFPAVPPAVNGVNNIGTDQGIYSAFDGIPDSSCPPTDLAGCRGSESRASAIRWRSDFHTAFVVQPSRRRTF